jgi:hypothetical protein
LIIALFPGVIVGTNRAVRIVAQWLDTLEAGLSYPAVVLGIMPEAVSIITAFVIRKLTKVRVV